MKTRGLYDDRLVTFFDEPMQVAKRFNMGVPTAQQNQFRQWSVWVYLTQTSGSNEPGVMYSIRYGSTTTMQ
jgi:hypothetical protein